MVSFTSNIYLLFSGVFSGFNCFSLNISDDSFGNSRVPEFTEGILGEKLRGLLDGVNDGITDDVDDGKTKVSEEASVLDGFIKGDVVVETSISHKPVSTLLVYPLGQIEATALRSLVSK